MEKQISEEINKLPKKKTVKCEVCGKPAMKDHVFCESCREESYLIANYHIANAMTRRFGSINYAGDTRFTRDYYKAKALLGHKLPLPEPGVKYSNNKTACLYCGNPEQVRIRPNGSEYQFNPMKGREFICSQCVQMFLDHDKGYLKKLLAIAEALENKNQTKAIKTFLEEDIERKTQKSKRGMERGRSLRKAQLARHKVR